MPRLRHPSYLLPAPSQIATTLVGDLPGLMRALWVTLRVALIALGLAVVIGSAIAFLFVQSPMIERSFFPYAIMMQVTPIVAIAPLIIILVKNTQLALDHLRHHHRDVPDHLQHHHRPAQRRARDTRTCSPSTARRACRR